MAWRAGMFVFAFYLAAMVEASGFESVPAPTREWYPEQEELLEINPVSGLQQELYSSSEALLIAESDYHPQSYPDLSYSKDELRKIAAILHEQGFHVLYYEDLTGEQIISVTERFVRQYGYDRNGRVVIYFSGHGINLTDIIDNSIENPISNEVGYFISVDTPTFDSGNAGFYAKAIRLAQITEWAEAMESRHVLVMLDSCFSGSILSKTKSGPSPLPLARNREAKDIVFGKPVSNRVRMFITAGTDSEEVPEESHLARYFVEALQGQRQSQLADANNDGFLTGSEFYNLVRAFIPSEKVRPTTPLSGFSSIPRLTAHGDIAFKLPPPPDQPTMRFSRNQEIDLVAKKPPLAQSFGPLPPQPLKSMEEINSPCGQYCSLETGLQTSLGLTVPPNLSRHRLVNPRLSCRAGDCVLARHDDPVVSPDGKNVTAKLTTWSGSSIWTLQADLVNEGSIPGLNEKFGGLHSGPSEFNPNRMSTQRSTSISERITEIQSQARVAISPFVISPTVLDISDFSIKSVDGTRFDVRAELDQKDASLRRRARQELAKLIQKMSGTDIDKLVSVFPNSSYRYALGVSYALSQVGGGWTSSNREQSILVLSRTAANQNDKTLDDTVSRAIKNLKRDRPR